jgi:single-strand DNA-binding protein
MSAPLRLLQLNDVRLVGRLTRDPEMRFTSSGTPMCRFDLAVNRRYKDSKSGEWKDDTSFIPVVVWREVAQRCGDRLKKGNPVYVEGRLKSRSWETKEGQKRSGLEVEARSVQFLEKSEAGPGAGASGGEEEPALGSLPAETSGADAPAAESSQAAEEVPF